MGQKPNQSYDYICFSDLAYEFDFSDLREAEKKIKRKLKYYKLGTYNQEQVDYIRELKNDLYREFSHQTRSKYFHKSKSDFADIADFDLEKMKTDFCNKYDKIAGSDMVGILNLAVYLYHLR